MGGVRVSFMAGRIETLVAAHDGSPAVRGAARCGRRRADARPRLRAAAARLDRAQPRSGDEERTIDVVRFRQSGPERGTRPRPDRALPGRAAPAARAVGRHRSPVHGPARRSSAVHHLASRARPTQSCRSGWARSVRPVRDVTRQAVPDHADTSWPAFAPPVAPRDAEAVRQEACVSTHRDEMRATLDTQTMPN